MTHSEDRINDRSAENDLLEDADQPTDPSKKLLQEPSHFLAVLADAIRDDIAFYSHDMEGKMVYLSKSAEQVLNHDPDYWIGRQFVEALTESPCNETLRSGAWKTPEPHAISSTCEIFDQDGKRLKLQYWRIHIIHGGKPIGISGIFRRLKCLDSQSFQAEDVLAKARLLTDVERQVVEHVVDGQMNKSIATMLDVAVRTVESRRSRAMVKLEVKSLPELVQLWIKVRQAEASVPKVEA
jgi:DNA-binding CsgD family transcriptional regulator